MNTQQQLQEAFEEIDRGTFLKTRKIGDNRKVLKPFLIGVAGFRALGKQRLRAIGAHLAATEGGCEVLTLDAYYHSQSHLSLEERAKLNFDHPDALIGRCLPSIFPHWRDENLLRSRSICSISTRGKSDS